MPGAPAITTASSSSSGRRYHEGPDPATRPGLVPPGNDCAGDVHPHRPAVRPGWDFWITRVLARPAVFFFLMVTGYFLAQSNWKRIERFLKKTALTYLATVVLYLPNVIRLKL